MDGLFCQGTLGDTYIFSCKLKNIPTEYRKIHHKTQHKYWYKEINDIYRLVGNLNVTFIEYYHNTWDELSSDVHEQNMEFFPKWDWPDGTYSWIEKPYLVIQPEAGKPQGFNHKELKLKTVQNEVCNSDIPVVLLGTSKKYDYIRCEHNLMNRTNLIDVMHLVSNANRFIGPEGLLSFVALSHKVPSEIYYKSHIAVQKRIIGSPWEKYCDELAYIGNL